MRVGFFAIVVDDDLGELGEELNHIPPATNISFANLCFRNIMPAFLYSGTNSRDVKLWAFQPHVPDAHLNSNRQGSFQKLRNSMPAKRGLECEIAAFVDGAFE